VVAKDAKGKFTVEDRGLTREQALAYAGELASMRGPSPAAKAPAPAAATTTAKAREPWPESGFSDPAAAERELRRRGVDVKVDEETAKRYGRQTAAVLDAIGRAVADGAAGADVGYTVVRFSRRPDLAKIEGSVGAYSGLEGRIYLDPEPMEAMVLSSRVSHLSSGTPMGYANSGAEFLPGRERGKYVVAHEYGHALDARNRLAMSVAERPRFAGKIGKLASRCFDYDRSPLTAYAGTNDHEMVAEAWAMRHTLWDRDLPPRTRKAITEALAHIKEAP